MESLSLFSGIGGFDLGFEQSGIDTVAMCEADERAQSILKRHWPDTPIFDDVRNIDGSDFRAIDVIHGGFPCQDISMAGKREGLEGDRSGLWWEFHRIVSEARPKFVVIENVCGLLSSGGRRDLGAIIGSLGKLGYMGGYRVLDARYFGVAQRRRRVFIVASLGDDCGQKVLFESDSLPGDIEKSGQQKRKDSGKAISGSEAKSGLLVESGVVSSLTKSFGGAGVDAQHAQNGWLISVENVLFSENQKQAAYSITPKTGGGNELRAQEINQANSLTAIGQHHDRGTKVVEDLGVRKITPTECERLMGFPDNWTLLDDQGKIIKDTPRYKMCGNAVVVNVAKWLGERIVSVSK